MCYIYFNLKMRFMIGSMRPLKSQILMSLCYDFVFAVIVEYASVVGFDLSSY